MWVGPERKVLKGIKRGIILKDALRLSKKLKYLNRNKTGLVKWHEYKEKNYDSFMVNSSSDDFDISLF